VPVVQSDPISLLSQQSAHTVWKTAAWGGGVEDQSGSQGGDSSLFMYGGQWRGKAK